MTFENHHWSMPLIAHVRVDVEGLTDPDRARRYAHICRDMAMTQRDRNNPDDANLFYALAEGLDRWAYEADRAYDQITTNFRQQIDTHTEETS